MVDDLNEPEHAASDYRPTTAIVFGHTAGLGRAVTDILLRAGTRVIGVARTSLGAESAALSELAADLTDISEVERISSTIRSDHSSFDLIVYAAGTLTAHVFDRLDYHETERLYRLNLFAPMIIESRLVDLIERNEADVINVTSSSLLEYYPQFTEYSTAKAAFAKFTDDLRRRLQSSRARVIEVCPSGFTSSMYVHMTGDKITRDETKQMQAADIAALMLYLIQLPKIVEVGRIYVNRKTL